MSSFAKGTVECWNTQYGYGFINSVIDGKEERIFVHHKSIVGVKRLKKFQRVKFEIGTNERGLVATNVEVIFNAKTKANNGTDGAETVQTLG